MPTEAEVSDGDREKILETARDYIESWLDGDAERMGRCLHPQLAKRSIEQQPDGYVIENLGREEMVAATTEGYGKRYQRPYEATILDAFGDIATVRVFSSVYMDYLHIGRCGDAWLIINALWQRRPGR